jgi:signal transduction histidine kinase
MITRDLFFSLDNPVIFSILLSITIAGLIYLFYVSIYAPLQQKHTLEKENLELKSSRLMAMFAELDPEPLFRFDSSGSIIFTNESGGKILSALNKASARVNDVISIPDTLSFAKIIENGEVHHFTQQIDSQFFDITVKGIPETNFGQIYCNDITLRRKSEEALKKSKSRLRELSVHIQKVQEEEKQKIARELHDNFGQILTSVKMDLERLKENGLNNEAQNNFSSIENKLEEARREIREISYRLRPRVLDDFGLSPALKMLCEDVSTRCGIKGVFQSNYLNGRLLPEVESNIYRIVQEALNNMAKHSQASEFNVQLIKHEDKVILTIDDDGIGFAAAGKNNGNSKSGMGMINMSERALSFNGKLDIYSSPGNGTEIILEVPLG